jgi:hypothetical protein
MQTIDGALCGWPGVIPRRRVGGHALIGCIQDSGIRLIAAATTVSAATVATATMMRTVGPASVVAAMTVAAVIECAVVATRGFVSVVLPATTRAKGDACDHQDDDHDHDSNQRSH